MWQVSDCRVHRWRARRRDIGTLVDKAAGGHPVHALLPEEVAVILDVTERWGAVDRSHRKLAHRGSYQQLVWVSPSSFRRVLVEHGLTLPQPQPRSRGDRRPWPDWLVWAPNRIWIWDVTHFTRARRVCFAIVDVVSRKWIDTLVSVEETATQVQVIFERSLQIEGLLDLLTDERLDLDPDDPRRPILLAVSDNGPPMTAEATRAFMALMAIAQHHGRPPLRPIRPGSSRSSATSKASGRTWRPSSIPPHLMSNWKECEWNTIRFDSTRRSVRDPDDEPPARRGHPPSRRDGWTALASAAWTTIAAPAQPHRGEP